MLAGAAMSHSFKFQLIFTLSTFEGEYIAICKAEKKAVWLEHFLA